MGQVLTVIVWKDKGKNPLNDAIDRGRFLAMAKRCEVEVKDGQHIILTITPQGDVREVMNDSLKTPILTHLAGLVIEGLDKGAIHLPPYKHALGVARLISPSLQVGG